MNKQTLFVCLAIFLPVLVPARCIKVGKTGEASTIQQALVLAAAGDTILISAGTYYEGSLNIRKPVVLLGQDKPVLDGEGKYEIIAIRSDKVTIRGLRLRNSGVSSIEDIAAIKLYNCRDVIIADNEIQDCFFGIYAQEVRSSIFENNRLLATSDTEQKSGNGIHCWKSDSLQVINNTVSGHRDGIYFEFVTHSLVWRNCSEQNLRYGLHFMFSHEDAYIGNVFRNNGAGVSVMFTHKVKMFNNSFEDNWGDAAYGLFLKEISDSYIFGNRFLHNTSGIFMEGVSRVLIERNEFSANGWGMKIQASCLDNNIVANNFSGNSFDVATNGSLVMSRFDRNYWDKYEGYDLNRDGIGDIPYRPVSLFSMIVEKNPTAMMLFRSFMTTLLDRTEKVIPSLTPEGLKDNFPSMKPVFP